jgi:ComEC/Rec2-related protein
MIPSIVVLIIAYGAGLWAGLASLVPSRGILVLCLALVAGCAWLGARSGAGSQMRHVSPFHGFAVLFLGFSVGTLQSAEQSAGCAARWTIGPHAALIELHDRPSRRGLTTGAVLYSSESCGGTVALQFDSGAAVDGGSRLLAWGTFHPPGVLRVRNGRTLRSWRSWRYVLRDAIGVRVDRLYGPRAPLVEALVTGRREDLDRSLRADFAAAGLAHLLAISGLHVGIIAGWLTLIFRQLTSRRGALVASTGITAAYVLLLGFPAPATRAFGFLAVRAMSRVLQRHPPRSVILALSVLLVLTINPAAMASAGAWLSAAAVWGTGAATSILPTKIQRSRAAQLLAASVGATVLTAPIAAFSFGIVAPIGILANLVAVPLAGVVVPGVLMSLVGGQWFAGGAGLALAAIERIASLASGIPGGHISGPAGFWFALPWAGLLVLLLWARHRWVAPSR